MKTSRMVIISVLSNLFLCFKQSILSFVLVNQDLLSNLKCTTCSNQLFLVNYENIRFHPVLGVLVCKVIVFKYLCMKCSLFTYIFYVCSHAESFIAQAHSLKTAMGKMSIADGVPKEALLFAATIAQMFSARYLNFISFNLFLFIVCRCSHGLTFP